MKRMSISWYCSFHVYSMLILFFFLVVAPSSYCEEDKYYSECAKPFDCGNLTDLYSPFWRDGRPGICGVEGFKLQCRDGEFAVITIENQEFVVEYVDQSSQLMIIAPRVLWDDICPANSSFDNITLDTNLFSYTPDFSLIFTNISLFYNCSNLESSISPAQKFQCLIDGENRDSFYGYDGLEGGWRQEISKCTVTVQVPVPKWALGENHSNLLNDLGDVLKEGFTIEYKYDENCYSCRDSGGICGTGIANSGFTCLCPDHADPISCLRTAGNKSIGSRRIVVKKIMVAVAVAGTLLTCTLIVLIIRQRQLSQSQRNNNDFEAFLEKHGPLAVRRYSYSQVKKMTNSFNEKLGQGGYGTVYKGTLLDGRLVAVKMLNASKGEGKEFLNEVAAISRTSHVNIVTLLGFCLEGEKRALLYEFMPNGSLDKLITHDTNLNLGWESVHQIVIGIAQGLEYLHRGCNTRILHFDIKPHNILLDENLIPKISDFGLAKLCTRTESIVSMLEARGTIGYIAPEVFCRNFGQVSSKSDVYSYGMLILEIVGARKTESLQIEGNNCSEMYFPNGIYKSLELENEEENISDEDGNIVRKLKLIGLWCIQTIPSDRPTMSNVIDMLQGNQTINIPPKPFPSSSPQFPWFSTTSTGCS